MGGIPGEKSYYISHHSIFNTQLEQEFMKQMKYLFFYVEKYKS